MIQAKHLRLGNFVKDRGNKVIRIDFIEHIQEGYQSKFGQLIFLEGTEVHPMTEYTDYAEPIPLTDNLLEKFGFNNIDRTNIFVKVMHEVNGTKLKSLAIYLDEDTYTVAIVDYYTGVEKTDLLHLDYKYLHQLQNLYYSLVGVELEVVW